MATNKGAELLESLKTQGLSQQEMLNRLDAIIDAESARPEGKRDRELIQACIDLQWFLTTGEHYTSEKEVARLKLDSALHKREKQTANGHGHSAKVLAAVFCLVAVEGFMLGELDMLKKAIADRIDEDIEIKTSDFSALSGLIEVRGIHPEHLPSGWVCEEYRYIRIDSIIYYAESYLKGQERIEYRCTIFPEADLVIGGMEQNEAGQEEKIGSTKVYIASNIEKKMANWNRNLLNFSIYGNYTFEELQQFILRNQ